MDGPVFTTTDRQQWIKHGRRQTWRHATARKQNESRSRTSKFGFGSSGFCAAAESQEKLLKLETPGFFFPSFLPRCNYT